ncbi:DUF4112 domain-containing protein [Halostella sp. JP-L12]|uniref:DUF4112 domain-containing protein n=1 Tax=Halostella TaxID=1843185 RepID=UPI000EF7A3CE|nr:MULTISPECIES: DUF4112 domain-containing protein [Halostella]NHN47130.1 DUF4112 domain-containing protein [Halostella sp. JP-L12]
MAQDELDVDPPSFGDGSTGEAIIGDQESALKRMRMVGTLLDDAIRVPGTDFRVGIDPIVGILPVAGDSVMSVISMYIVLEAANLGVPMSTVAKMVLNIAVDTVFGSVPVIGTLFDAGWKANKRNVKLVEQHLDAV